PPPPLANAPPPDFVEASLQAGFLGFPGTPISRSAPSPFLVGPPFKSFLGFASSCGTGTPVCALGFALHEGYLFPLHRKPTAVIPNGVREVSNLSSLGLLFSATSVTSANSV